MSVDTSHAWAVRRMRAVMLQSLPDLPRALCKTGYNPNMWHPERANRKQEQEAALICFKCPEMLECLAFAIRAHPVSGIWGGTTEAQRGIIIENLVRRQDMIG